jgi:hypothetical protein
LNQFSELLAKDVISEIDFCALCLDLYTKTGLEQLIGIAHAHADKLSDDQKEDFEKLKIFIENRATAAGDVGE